MFFYEEAFTGHKVEEYKIQGDTKRRSSPKLE